MNIICIMKKIIDEIKFEFLKKKISKEKNVKFMLFSRIDNLTQFEGANALSKCTKLKRSHIGYGSYIASNTKMENVFIGRYCSIGPHVSIVNGKHPTKDYVSTHPSFYSVNNVTPITYVNNDSFEEFDYVNLGDKNYDVYIGNDVWIGSNVIIMGGVTISDGAIIGAGSIVTKDVEPYSIVVGVPAKEIRKRFSSEQIEFLLSFKWWNKSENWIKNNAKYFNNIESLIKVFNNDMI